MRGSSTKAARVKRYVFNAILALVYIGIPVFGVLAFYPVVADWHDRSRELTEAESALARWLRSMALPTQARVEHERSYTEAMQAEHGRARGYYESRDRLLERSLLDSHSGDPVQVKLKYADLRTALARRARCPDVRRFMPSYSWEGPTEEPKRSDLKAIEKRACIAEVLVDMLGAGAGSVIDSIAVGNPFPPSALVPASPEDEGQAAPPPDGEAPAYVFWPVELVFEAPFQNAGELLNCLATPPGRFPPMLIHSLHLTGLPAGRVRLTVGLRVMDFD